MQELKNILGSRKKGAQEPHAAREPRNDYQGYTTTNLKGIFLERLPVTAGSSYCTSLLSFFFLLCPCNIQSFDPILLIMGVFVPFRELGPDAG